MASQAELKEEKRKLQEEREKLEAERRAWEEEKEKVRQTKVFDKVVTLDVGGTKYRTTPSTLTKYSDPKVAAMFSGRHDLPQQEDGSYFIDRDGEVFKYILMYLRDRDLCFNYLHDDRLRNPQGQPSPLESSLLKLVAYEAQYFELSELETKARIVLNEDRARDQDFEFTFTAYERYSDYAYHLDPQCHELDYGSQHKLQCHQFSEKSKAFKHGIVKTKFEFTDGKNGTDFKEKITFDSCDLSGVTFQGCYFQGGVSFKGCILHGTKFERVGGLVHHKVHFTPWQVAQADFEQELLQALKDNGCIY